MELPPREVAVLQQHKDIDADKPIFAPGVDVDRGPKFSTGEVGKIFFGWGRRYVNILLKDGTFGEVGTLSESGRHLFTLADVESMAHSLWKSKVIDTPHFMDVLRCVTSIARIWRLI